ncbi:MAG: acetate--CoA ligase family protein [Pseudomonadota bacterium]
MSSRLNRLFRPRSLAFVGGDSAAAAVEVARRGGFDGTLQAVNPRRQTLAGVPTVPDLRALQIAPDAAFVAVPAHAVVDTVATLAGIGAGAAVVYSAGFAELGEDGELLQTKLVEVAGTMPIIGPNSSGVLNFVSGAHLWPFQHGGTRVSRGTAFITQSGMLGNTLTLNDRSLPFAYVISAGNQATCGIEETIEALHGDDAVSAIALYIEGLNDVPRFARAAARSIDAGVPIVALKAGSSKIGAELTVTHTGSLAGTNDLYSDLFERLGVIAVDSPVEMLETCKLLQFAGAPRGRRLLGLTCSGGDATMLADTSERLGLDLVPLDHKTARAVRERLPPLATVSNPLDYTTPLWGNEEALRDLFGVMLKPGYDAAVLVQDYLPEPSADNQNSLADARAFAAATCAQRVPGAVVSVLPENFEAGVRQTICTHGLAPLQGIEHALKAIRAASGSMHRDPAFAVQYGCERHAHAEDHPRHRLLDEWQGKQLLANAGVPIPSGACGTADMLRDLAATLGYPVALKCIHPSLTHKSDAGAVQLNIANDAALEQAATVMRDSIARSHPEIRVEQFLVEQMVTGAIAELLVGFYRDPTFGPVLVLGSGGVLVELLGDTRSVLLPANQRVIADAIRKLKVAKLLCGFRGGAAADLDMVASTVTQIVQALLEANAVECDVNPLMVTHERAYAADALITVAGSPPD